MSTRIYVWEFPVRLTHWLNVISILTLLFTGFYIGAPFIHAARENQFIMATMRFLHFVAAYVFMACVLVRLYWWFAGNKYARLEQFIPTSSERRKDLIDTLLFYVFLKKDSTHATGHNALAGLAYFLLFIVFIVEILTGFALYSESHVGAFWTLAGGWLFSIFSTGTVRLVHHLLMWIIVPFTIVHVYLSVMGDLLERNGLIGSMLSGYKTQKG